MLPLNTQLPINEAAIPDTDFTSSNNPSGVLTIAAGAALHGISYGSGLTTANATYTNACWIDLNNSQQLQINGNRPGDCRILQIPGRTTTRGTTGQAFDTANDLQWLPYAIISGNRNYAFGRETGIRTVLCTFGVGKTFQIKLTSTTGSSFTNRKFHFEIKAFGRFGLTYTPPATPPLPQYMTVDTGSVDYAGTGSLISSQAPQITYYAEIVAVKSDGSEFIVGMVPAEPSNLDNNKNNGWPIAFAKFNVSYVNDNAVNITYAMLYNMRNGSIWSGEVTPPSDIADKDTNGFTLTTSTVPIDYVSVPLTITYGPAGSGISYNNYTAQYGYVQGADYMQAPRKDKIYLVSAGNNVRVRRICWLYYVSDALKLVECEYRYEDQTFRQTTELSAAGTSSFTEVRTNGTQTSFSGSAGATLRYTYKQFGGRKIRFTMYVDGSKIDEIYVYAETQTGSFTTTGVVQQYGTVPNAGAGLVQTNTSNTNTVANYTSNLPGVTSTNTVFNPGYDTNGQAGSIINTINVTTGGTTKYYKPFLHLYASNIPAFIVGLDGVSMYTQNNTNGSFPYRVQQVGYIGSAHHSVRWVNGKTGAVNDEYGATLDSGYAYCSVHPVSGSTQGLKLAPYCYV